MASENFNECVDDLVKRYPKNIFASIIYQESEVGANDKKRAKKYLDKRHSYKLYLVEEFQKS